MAAKGRREYLQEFLRDWNGTPTLNLPPALLERVKEFRRRVQALSQFFTSLSPICAGCFLAGTCCCRGLFYDEEELVMAKALGQNWPERVQPPLQPDDPYCPFLGPQGCALGEDKPWLCVDYRCFRLYNAMGDGKAKALVQEIDAISRLYRGLREEICVLMREENPAGGG